VKLCQIDDVERDICIKNSIQNLLPEIKNHPDFFVPIDPYFWDSFTGNLRNNFVQGGFKIKNLKMYGMSQAEVRNVESQISDFGMNLELDLFFTKLETSAFYKSNVILSAIKILSKGQFNVTMHNVTNKWTMKGKLVNVEGEQFLEIYDSDIDMTIGDLEFSVSGLFENPTLSKFFV
jgi:Haemolymph juvenile hormone binding protein (JHBP)